MQSGLCAGASVSDGESEAGAAGLTGGQRKAVYDSRTAVIGDGGSGISSMDRRKSGGA